VPPQSPCRWSTAFLQVLSSHHQWSQAFKCELWDGDFLPCGRITGFWELLSKSLGDKAQPGLQVADLTPPRWASGSGEVLGHKEEGEGLTHAADSTLISPHSQTLNKCVWERDVSAHQELLASHRAELRGQSCPLSLGGNLCLENGADSAGGCQEAHGNGMNSQQAGRTSSAVLSHSISRGCGHSQMGWSAPALGWQSTCDRIKARLHFSELSAFSSCEQTLQSVVNSSIEVTYLRSIHGFV